MKNDYVTLGVAEGMQRLGYKERSVSYYVPETTPFFKNPIKWWKDSNKPYIWAPLYQEAFEWFREKYNLDSNIICFYNEGSTKKLYRYDIIGYNIEPVIEDEDDDVLDFHFNSYEEAEDHCLLTLINAVYYYDIRRESK